MALKRAFSYEISSAIMGSEPVTVEVDDVRNNVRFVQDGGEGGEQIVTIRFDELYDLERCLEEIRKEFAPRPFTGGRD